MLPGPLLLSLVAVLLTAGACHGPGATSTGGGAPAPADDEETAPPRAAPIQIGEGPDGEIVPGLALPPATEPVSGSGAPGSSAPNPDKLANQEQLIADARKALAEDRPADALAIVDVLVVLDPDDTESIELRATTLERLGDADGAKIDRERCCKLGRATCCR